MKRRKSVPRKKPCRLPEAQENLNVASRALYGVTDRRKLEAPPLPLEPLRGAVPEIPAPPDELPPPGELEITSGCDCVLIMR